MRSDGVEQKDASPPDRDEEDKIEARELASVSSSFERLREIR